MIVAAIKKGEHTHHWAPLVVHSAGDTAVFQVSAHPLEVAGTWPTPAPIELDAICSALGGLPLTPYLLDLRYLAAEVQNAPCPKWYKDGVGMRSPLADADHKHRVAATLPCSYRMATDVIGNAGKHYVYPLEEERLYGWHLLGMNKFSGVRLKPSKAGGGLRVIQPLSSAHSGPDDDILDGYHDDYSMTVIIVKDICTVNGAERSTREVFDNPAFAQLCWGSPSVNVVATLTLGDEGPAVLALQYRLITLGSGITADGDYGPKTRAAVTKFQRTARLHPDGKAGPLTLAALYSEGAPTVRPAPPPPNFGYPSLAWRVKNLGAITFKHTPSDRYPERISLITAPPVERVTVPELAGIANSSGQVWWIASRAEQLQALFKAWGGAGLLHHIKSWDGSLNRRLKRGRSGNTPDLLSDHAWGSAFDINARWNPYGGLPAGWGEQGSVFPLIQIAHEHKFYCGLHFKGRSDAMHFALCL